MKKSNKSITSVKKLGNKALNESVTLVKDKKTASNKSQTKVGKAESNKSITSVSVEQKTKINKSVTLVGKTKKRESNESHTKVGKVEPNKSITSVENQENKASNESVTFVESKELQLFKNESKFKALEEMLDMKSKMAEVIDWYEKKHKNVIEIPELKINAKALHGNLILKTFKLYESAVKKIADFIEKHSQYKQQDIISQALIEFAERYH